ncbi:MAG: ATP-binding cassette domain-containing protein [Gemmatimonadaceae bacterium]
MSTTGALIEARNLRKSFGDHQAIDGVDLTVEAGRIVGVIGPNGAGKSTLLNAIVGLTSIEGDLRVMGLDPWRQRDALMLELTFVADVAVLPRWMKVSQLIDYTTDVHPRFDRVKAMHFLEGTTIRPGARIKDLSKGMVTQLHLALVMAIDARLLVLDEPTIGLDGPYRKRFFDSLLGEYLDREQTILLTTHSVEEIEHVVTDIIVLDRGRVALALSRDALDARFNEVRVHPEHVSAAHALAPAFERQALGQSIMIFDGVARERLTELGEVRTPSIASLSAAYLGSEGY